MVLEGGVVQERVEVVAASDCRAGFPFRYLEGNAGYSRRLNGEEALWAAIP